MPNSTPPRLKSASSATGQHLYSRGKFYYFRSVLPVRPQQGSDRKEIRLALRTGYRHLAKRLATKLQAHLYELAEEPLIDYSEIKRRMNRYLRGLLEQDHNNLEPRAGFQWPDKAIDLSPGEVGLYNARIIQSALNDKERLSEIACEVIPILIHEGFLKEEEATPENRLTITKAYLQTQITYLKLMEKRENGDFIAEEAVFAAGQIRSDDRQPLHEPKQPGKANKPVRTPRVKTAPLYSTIIERYIEEKTKAGRWKAHSVADHRLRLSTFLDIIGDNSTGA